MLLQLSFHSQSDSEATKIKKPNLKLQNQLFSTQFYVLARVQGFVLQLCSSDIIKIC